MKDPKKLNIPNICFSLSDDNDKREKKFSKQRIERGFDDSETWSLRDTIGKFILPRLKKFREITTICPIDMKMNEWHEKLDKMIHAFELLTKDKGLFILNDKESKEFEEGMNLFHTLFMSLWW